LSAKKIAFLINPAAGTAGTKKQTEELTKHLKGSKDMLLFETKTPQDMLELSKELAEKNYEAIFACGGDGTLNLVSSQLLGSETALGMIPLGSGNGYARHHRIPMHWTEAIKIMEHPKRSLRDTGLINNIYFLNIAGIGYAAKISHAFKGEQKRGLTGYARTVFKNLKMEPFHAQITNENMTWQGETWIVDFCNGSQWGNNFRIEPGARDDDGSLTAVIFKKVNPIKVPAIGFRIATQTVSKSPDIIHLPGANFLMEFDGKQPLHVDGEPVGFVENRAEIKILPKSLWIWTM
jgi:diacylglycerol kinase (ATP)